MTLALRSCSLFNSDGEYRELPQVLWEWTPCSQTRLVPDSGFIWEAEHGSGLRRVGPGY